MAKVMMLLSMLAATLCACMLPPSVTNTIRSVQDPASQLVLVPSHSQIATHVSRLDDGLRVDVYDERGIGALDISVAHPVPGSLVVRLHLRALEEFTLQVGDERIVTRGSRGREVVDSTEDRSGVGPQAPSQEPVPMPLIAAFHGDGAPAQSVPLETGYFDVHLPVDLSASPNLSFLISWVDYYR